MADLNISEALDNLLSDPSMGDKISEIMKSLNLTGDSPQSEEKSDFPDSFMDINKIMKLKTLYDESLSQNDPKVTLLSALKPYLSETRNKNLDSMLKFFKVYKMITSLKDSDLLKELF